MPFKLIVNAKEAIAQDTIEPFEIESDPEKIIEDEGVRFIANEIVVLLEDGATLKDAINVAGLVNGIITGFDPNPPAYKIEIPTNDTTGMKTAIQTIIDLNNPLIVEAIPNLITTLF